LTKRLVIGLLILSFISAVSADFYYNQDSSTISGDGSYILTDSYDSQEEFATEFVAPFLLITIILQLGFNKVLRFTLDVNDNDNPLYQDNEAKNQARKYSIVMSLVVTGMITASPIFGLIKSYVSIVFGSIIFVFGAAVAGAIIYFFYKVVT